MSLKSMHAMQKQQNPQQSSSNIELIEDQMRRITELEQIIAEQNGKLCSINTILQENARLQIQNKQLLDSQAEIQRKAKSMNANSEIRLQKASELESGFYRRLELEKRDIAYQLQQKISQQLKKEKVKLIQQTVASTISVTVYATICTLLLLLDHGAALKTAPQWFVHRTENILTLWAGLMRLHSWLNLNISGMTNEFVGSVISGLISGLLAISACAGIVLLSKQAIRKFFDSWEQASLQQRAVSVSLIAAAAMVGTICAEKITIMPMNVISWWIVWMAAGHFTLASYREYRRRKP